MDARTKNLQSPGYLGWRAGVGQPNPSREAAELHDISLDTAHLDVDLSTRASAANQTTEIARLASILAQLDVALSTRASTANQTTEIARLTSILAQLDVALSTRLAEATFIARLNTLGQKAMVASAPVVIASDQSAIPVTSTPAALPSAPVNDRKSVAVTNTAVQLQSHALTQGVIVQALAGNAGIVYVGDSAVTSANGYELDAGQAAAAAVSNTNALWVNGTAGDGVCYVGS